METGHLEPAQPRTAAHVDADFAVSDETREALRDAIPVNTQRGYEADWFSFTTWCGEVGRTPLPATAETVTEYVTFLKTAGPYRKEGKEPAVRIVRLGRPSAPRSIERALSAIRTRHAFAGYDGQPGLRAARLLLNKYRRSRPAAGRGKAPALTANYLRAMVSALDPGDLAGARDRALLVLSFAMLNRRSETVAIRRDEIRAVPQGLDILIPFSKTDQQAEGELIGVNYGSDEATCPVRLTLRWLSMLQEAHPSGSALFPAIDQKGHVAGTPEYRGRNTTGHLNGSAVTIIMRRAGKAAGLDEKVVQSLTGHSIRSGGATAAYEAGADPLHISRRGRWKDGSAVLLGYIREVDKWKNDPMKGVL